MKQKSYKAEVIERFMNERERASFDKIYESAKVRNLGALEAEKLKQKDVRTQLTKIINGGR